MQDTFGSIIDEGTDGGKPHADHDSGTPNPDSNGIGGPERVSESYIGFEPIEHATERIDSSFAGSGGSGDSEPRRTKSGRVDRRTLRGRRTAETGTETEEIPSTLGGVGKLGITDLLLTIHMMGEEILKLEGLSLDREEAQKLSKAIQEVNKHYAINIDPKKLAIANLIGVAGSIYVPRFIAWSNNSKKAQLEKVQPINQPTEQRTPAQAASGKMMTPSQLWPEHG